MCLIAWYVMEIKSYNFFTPRLLSVKQQPNVSVLPAILS